MHMAFVHGTCLSQRCIYDPCHIWGGSVFENSWQLPAVTFVTKSIILVVKKILSPPLLNVLMSSSIFREKSNFVWENKKSTFWYFTRVYTGIIRSRSKCALTFDSVTVVKMSFCWLRPYWKGKSVLWARSWVMFWITWQYLISLFVMLQLWSMILMG